MTGRSERRPNDPMLILFRVRTCHVPKEAEPSLCLSLGYGWKLVVCRDGTGSHFVTQRPSDPGIQRPGDPVDPVILFYNELQMSTYV